MAGPVAKRANLGCPVAVFGSCVESDDRTANLGRHILQILELLSHSWNFPSTNRVAVLSQLFGVLTSETRIKNFKSKSHIYPKSYLFRIFLPPSAKKRPYRQPKNQKKKIKNVLQSF